MKKKHTGSPAGYSLVELLIVVAIMGILSLYVTFNISSNASELKSSVFNTKSQFQRAKFEAIKRNRDVYIDFDFDASGTIDNGYTLWVDEDSDGTYIAANDTIIETVEFLNGTAIYDNTGTEEPGASDDGPSTRTIADGVSIDAGGDSIIMTPEGLSENGAVYIYFPNPDGTIAAGPWAVITNTVGRIRVDEWTSTGWVTDI